MPYFNYVVRSGEILVSWIEISTGFIYEQTKNLIYKVSHLARAHGQALKDQSRMSLVLLSNHEILLRNDRTSRRLSLFLFTRYAQMFRWMNLAEKDLKLLGWNNLLCACTRGIIIFPHDTWCRSLPIQQMFMLITLKIILRIKLLTTSLDVGLSLERGAYTVWRICSME